MSREACQAALEVVALEVVAREVAAWEVEAAARGAARESGFSARPGCPSQGLSAATYPPHSKADRQSQGPRRGGHGQSVGFAPRGRLASQYPPGSPQAAEPTGLPGGRRCGQPGHLPNSLADSTTRRIGRVSAPVSAPWARGGRCTGGHTAWFGAQHGFRNACHCKPAASAQARQQKASTMAMERAARKKQAK